MVLATTNTNTILAAEFGCGTYGAHTYGSSQVCSQTTDAHQPTKGELPKTGADAFMPLWLGVILIATSILLLSYNAFRRIRERR